MANDAELRNPIEVLQKDACARGRLFSCEDGGEVSRTPAVCEPLESGRNMARKFHILESEGPEGPEGPGQNLAGSER